MATLGELVEQLRAEAMDNRHDPSPPAILNAAADRLAALDALMLRAQSRVEVCDCASPEWEDMCVDCQFASDLLALR